MSLTIQRVIIILGEKLINFYNGQSEKPNYVENDMRGIYVPWSLDPEEIKKKPPLFLTFNGTHFSACIHFQKTIKNGPYPYKIRYNSLHDELKFRYVPNYISDPKTLFQNYVTNENIYEFSCLNFMHILSEHQLITDNNCMNFINNNSVSHKLKSKNKNLIFY